MLSVLCSLLTEVFNLINHGKVYLKNECPQTTFTPVVENHVNYVCNPFFILGMKFYLKKPNIVLASIGHMHACHQNNKLLKN